MDKLIIQGGIPLNGTIQISGSKNSCLPLMAASLLTDKEIVLSNVPQLSDVKTISQLLTQLGVSINIDRSASSEKISLHADRISSIEAPYDMVRKMRASVLVLGPLLARCKEAKVSLPGGCAIGLRPIDQHLKAFKELGAEIDLESGYVHAKAPKGLKGAEVYFDVVSVGATENALMAATLANGKTILRNCAVEPEIIDLANMLKKMGANIKGAGSSVIEIDGVPQLSGTSHQVIFDRIEAVTYAIAAAATNGEVTLENIQTEYIQNVLDKLIEMGVIVKTQKNSVKIIGNQQKIATNITTGPYPGFPTDAQAQMMALLALSSGTSIVNETIFENRFMHVAELCRMGANISINGHLATIIGGTKLFGAEVMATDLRASSSLVIAALAAQGETTINRIYHLDRGYEKLEDKLNACGAKVKRIINS
jgi:UDP-N-acetylglucosamine 1-carboxyvinyltransferase